MEIVGKIFLVLAVGFVFSSFTYFEENNVYSLTIEVDELQNSNGNVQFTLYNEDGSIPDQHYEKYFKQLIAEINDKSSSVTFTNLPKGSYAVNILHDENSDGEIEKGFILPTEGIGFSNFTTIGFMNRPSFKKAKFDLNADKIIKVKIVYM